MHVSVSLNGMQFGHQGATVNFRYLTDGYIFVSAVSPALGPTSGATLVNVTGSNFVILPSGTTCRFGELITNATVLDEHLLQCASPGVSASGVAEVQMSHNDQEYYSGAEFLYFDDGSRLLSPLPSMKGKGGGGVTSVRIEPPLDRLAAERGDPRCLFGGPGCMGALPTGVDSPGCSVSAATIVGPAMLRCVVPTATSDFADGAPLDRVPLWMSLNGVQFNNLPTNFTYVAIQPEIHSIDPPIGPAFGGTDVLVRGPGLHVGDEQRCRFGEITVEATPADDGSGLRCSSPKKALAIEEDVLVTLNGEDWVGNATAGRFISTLSAAPETVNPTAGPRHGGTVIRLNLLPRPQAHQDASRGYAACKIGNGTAAAAFVDGLCV